MEDHDVIVECAKYVLDSGREDLAPLSNSVTRPHSTTELATALGITASFDFFVSHFPLFIN